MLMVLVATLFASATVLSMVPERFTKPAQLFAALASLTAAIVTGFYQAKLYPKTKAQGEPGLPGR
jgi:hypothetical protein